jgi:cysteine desulfurase
LQAIDGVVRNGAPARSAPHILNVTFPGVDGTSLLCALADIALSQGSACASSVPEPSHVLSSIGLSDALAQSTLRFGVGRFTDPADIEFTIERVRAEYGRLRGLGLLAPAWCSS